MKIKIYFFWLIGLFLITYAGSFLLPLNPNSGLGSLGLGKQFNYWLSLAQWDGGYYLNIASQGYRNIQDFAFFPFYPFLIKIVGFFTFKDYLFAALLISNVSFLLFLKKLYFFTSKLFSSKTARLTILAFLFFPTAYFCLIAYSESLFLLLSIYTIDAIYEKKFTNASILACLATSTRFIGIIFIFLIPFMYLTQTKINYKRIVKAFLYGFISAYGILIFAAFSLFTTSDPLRFISVQALWQRTISDPISSTFSYFWDFLNLRSRPINDYLDFTITLILFTLLMYGVKKIPKSLWLFSLAALLIPTYTGTLTSMPRYSLASIGSFIIFGKLLEEKPFLKIPVFSIMLALQCLLASLFLNGHWIA